MSQHRGVQQHRIDLIYKAGNRLQVQEWRRRGRDDVTGSPRMWPRIFSLPYLGDVVHGHAHCVLLRVQRRCLSHPDAELLGGVDKVD
jgi:hypothetical protein